MSLGFDEHGYKKVKIDDCFYYDCSGCGDCCRNVKDSIMVESFDLFRLAQFFGLEMSEAYLRYTDVAFLAWGFPVFMLKTKQHMDACIFLKSSRCSVHSAKPRTCRVYPLGVGPDDEKPGEFLNLVVSKKQHHFTGQPRRIGDWMDENLTPEDREFIMLDYNYAGELAKLMKRIDRRQEDQVLKLVLFFKYTAYDMLEDFLPQFIRNMEQLKEKLQRISAS